MIPCVRLKDGVWGPALRPSRFSSGILTRDPLQYASHSWILGRMPFNCVGQRTIDSFVGRSQSCGPNWIALQQAFSPPPTFAVSLLSPLASSQVSASRATFTETPLFEVCSAKVGPCHFVLHQHLSWVSGYHLRGSLHSDLNVECIVTAIRRPWNSSYSKHSVRVPSLRLRRACLDRHSLPGDDHCL